MPNRWATQVSLYSVILFLSSLKCLSEFSCSSPNPFLIALLNDHFDCNTPCLWAELLENQLYLFATWYSCVLSLFSSVWQCISAIPSEVAHTLFLYCSSTLGIQNRSFDFQKGERYLKSLVSLSLHCLQAALGSTGALWNSWWQSWGRLDLAPVVLLVPTAHQGDPQVRTPRGLTATSCWSQSW